MGRCERDGHRERRMRTRGGDSAGRVGGEERWSAMTFMPDESGDCSLSASIV